MKQHEETCKEASMTNERKQNISNRLLKNPLLSHSSNSSTNNNNNERNSFLPVGKLLKSLYWARERKREKKNSTDPFSKVTLMKKAQQMKTVYFDRIFV